jgi:hypothetical protein
MFRLAVALSEANILEIAEQPNARHQRLRDTLIVARTPACYPGRPDGGIWMDSAVMPLGRDARAIHRDKRIRIVLENSFR